MTEPTAACTADEDRRHRARLSLVGLSIGDAFGQQFFARPADVAIRRFPPAPWWFTDDTVMSTGKESIPEAWWRAREPLSGLG